MSIPVTIITRPADVDVFDFIRGLMEDFRLQDAALLVTQADQDKVAHDVVGIYDGDTPSASAGCTCCNASNGIKHSLFDLWNRRRNREIRPFSHVLIVNSAADPTALINALLAPASGSYSDRIVAGQYRLARVLALCGALDLGAV